VEQTHSSAVDSRSDGKEVPHLLWNPEPHERHHWTLPQRILVQPITLMTCVWNVSGYSIDYSNSYAMYLVMVSTRATTIQCIWL
jgi:hypothetical protein